MTASGVSILEEAAVGNMMSASPLMVMPPYLAIVAQRREKVQDTQLGEVRGMLAGEMI